MATPIGFPLGSRANLQLFPGLPVQKYVHFSHGEVLWNHLLHHLVGVLHPPASPGETEVLVERLVRVVGVVQQGVGLLHVVRANNTIGVIFSSQETLEKQMLYNSLITISPLTLDLSNMPC